MPETTLILPILAILLPGVLVYWLGRKAGRIWPGIILDRLAIGRAGWLVHRSAGAAAGAAADGAKAAPRTLAVFTLAAPAAMSALAGIAFARFRAAQT